MTELEELRLAYAECSRQKNKLLTKHKHLSAEVEAMKRRLYGAEACEGKLLPDPTGKAPFVYTPMCRILEAEVEALRKDKLAADALRANLAASWFYGRWVAETPNEREQQVLMEQAGWWPWTDEDALVAAVGKARLAARPGGQG